MRRPLRSEAARAVAALAIELGDPGKMAQARRLHRTGAVIEVGVDVGRVRCVVAVDDASQAIVELCHHGTDPAGAVPDPMDLETTCSLDPDVDMCVHRLAAVLGFAEEIEATPDVLGVWVSGPPGAEEAAPPPPHRHHPYFTGDHRLLDEDELPPLPLAAPESLTIEGLDVWPVLLDAQERVRTAVTD